MTAGVVFRRFRAGNCKAVDRAPGVGDLPKLRARLGDFLGEPGAGIGLRKLEAAFLPSVEGGIACLALFAQGVAEGLALGADKARRHAALALHIMDECGNRRRCRRDLRDMAALRIIG